MTIVQAPRPQYIFVLGCLITLLILPTAVSELDPADRELMGFPSMCLASSSTRS